MGWPDQPSDPPLVRAPAGSVAWTDEGAGPAILAVHGLPGSVRDFRWIAPALPAARIVRVALPGFSGEPAGGHTPDALARHVVATADAAGLDRVVLMGHSFGCGIAARAAAMLGDRVRGLALLAPAGIRPHNLLRHTRVVGVIGRAATTPGLRRATGAALLPLYRAAGFRHATADEARHTFAIVSRWPWPDMPALVARLAHTPALVTWADDDPIVEEARFADWTDALGGAPLRFPDGGHAIQKTRALEIAAALAPLLG